MHSFGRALIGLLILEVAVAQVRATVLLPADLAALVRGSQAVVHGRVVNVRAAWADGRRRIESFVTVEVVEYFKGDLGGRVTIRVPGGQIGRYRSVTVGAPTFRSVRAGSEPGGLSCARRDRVLRIGGDAVSAARGEHGREGYPRRIVAPSDPAVDLW